MNDSEKKKKSDEDDEAPEAAEAEPQFEQHGKPQTGVQPEEEGDIPEAGQ